MSFINTLRQRAHALGRRIDQRTDFPVLDTALTLWRRFEQDRLGVTASSLTFTTVLALVPFFAVVLSVFTAFPEFDRLRQALQNWLVESLIPASISHSVLDYLTQFASKASQLGMAGFAMLFVTTLSLLLTMDTTLNAIWRVQTPRPLGQRLLLYWAALTLGPLLMGASLAITSYVVTHSSGLLPGLPGGVGLGLGLLQWGLLAAGMTLLYRFVPNTPVRWAHALAGGMFASACMALVRWGMGLYLARIPTYSVIYGAFATVPLLLMWVYLSWLIVLLGAVIAAYLPVLTRGVARRGGTPGWDFELAAETLHALLKARDQGRAGHQGLTQAELAHALRVGPLQLNPALQALQALGWTGRLLPGDSEQEPRHILLVEPAQTPLAPLIERLLLPAGATLGALRKTAQTWPDASVQTLIGHMDAQPAAPGGKYYSSDSKL